MKHLALIAILCGTAAADDRGAFCEVTPCLPGPVTRRTLANDELIGKLWCAKGSEAGADARGHLVFCTTARALDIDGLHLAKGAYTLVHPNGHVYQTTLRSGLEVTLADHSTVRCAADLIAMTDDGHLGYCKLAAPRPGSPRARVGEGITFHPDGRVRGMTLDEPFRFAGLALPAGASAVWDAAGHPSGGHLPTALQAGAFSIQGDFTLHPSGALHVVRLAAKATLFGHELPVGAELELRDDGSLAAAEYVSARGFMIHGEPWSDTVHATYDPKGKVTSSDVTHFQSDVRPPKFR